MEFDLKSTLKTLKVNEPTISAILGAIVLVAIAILVVNYFKKAPTSFSTSVPGVQTESTAKSETLTTKYTVKKGDHLWKIAEDHYKSGYNWVDIAQANNLKNPSILAEGQELTLPQVEAKPITVVAENTKQNAPPAGKITVASAQIEAIAGNTYTVEKGDSLWEVAVRAYSDGYQWPKLAQENKLKNPNHITPGQTITIPR